MAAILAVTSAATLGAATPATAAANVTATSSGTVVTVAATGDVDVSFACPGGLMQVSGSAVSPRVSCSQVTSVTVTGDAGNQTVHGDQLGPAFGALTAVSMTLGDGADTAIESPVADTIDMGAGADTVVLRPESGPANPRVDLGTGPGKTVVVDGGPDVRAMYVTSTGPTLSVDAQIDISAVDTESFRAATGAERLVVRGSDPLSLLDSTGVTSSSTIKSVTLDGEGFVQNDLHAGNTPTRLIGNGGSNGLVGGAADDVIETYGWWDQVATGGGHDTIIEGGPQFGQRSIAVADTDTDPFTAQLPGGDRLVRMWAQPNGASSMTVSLLAAGRQDYPAGIASVTVGSTDGTGGPGRHLVDTVPLERQRQSYLGNGGDLLDLTVPPGEHPVVGGTPANGTITFTAHQPIQTTGFADRLLHAPWSTRNESFAHRIVRDLYLRFTTADERTWIRAALDGGTTTRAAVAAGLTDTDAYRGLDVDRAYEHYLGRSPDAAGRAYWVGRLRSGTSLRAMRASLLGSDEFFRAHGSDDTRYLQAAYQATMNRVIEPSGLAYWTSRLRAGASRGSVADQVLSTWEPRATIMIDQFIRFVGRRPNDSEWSQWLPNLRSPTGERLLIVALAGGDEYLNQL